jgi:DNA transposition AAA+ family ATPase
MDDVRARVLAWLASRPDVAPDRLDAHTRFAGSTCRHWRTGSLKAGVDLVTADFARVLALAEAGEILPLGAEPVRINDAHPERIKRVKSARDFYMIETVRNTAVALNYAAEQAAIVVITGEYGIGKSEALRHWRTNEGRQHESVVFEFDEFAAASITDFVACLAELLGVPCSRGINMGGRNMRAVCTALEAAPRLIIFDQCETVRPRVMQVIREIWDRTRHAGVGMALVAAPVLLERLTASRMRDLEALRSRVGAWAKLLGVSRAEMEDVIKQEGITGVSREVMDLWWGATRGSMRRLMASVDMIRAAHGGRQITTKTIAGVAGNLWGMEIAA